MTNEQKRRIAEFRSTGISYAKTGEAIGISGNIVKTYCRRNHITVTQKSSASDPIPAFCRECGAPLAQIEKRKPRIFCSKACREKRWHAHPEQLNRKAVYDFRCAGSGKPFSSYGNRHRKYCSRECYITGWFKDGGRHERTGI